MINLRFSEPVRRAEIVWGTRREEGSAEQAKAVSPEEAVQGTSPDLEKPAGGFLIPLPPLHPCGSLARADPLVG